MVSKIQLTQFHIEKLICFLSNHVKLSQGHMVDYFINDLYATCIPVKLQKEIEIVGLAEAINILFDEQMSDIPLELGNYIKTAKGYSLYNIKDICESRQDFYKSIGSEDDAGLKLEVFMKSKKSHEVETLSIVAKNIAKRTNTSHLVDIGDGKGYLSSLIAFYHKLPVLGVDGSLVNTESAVKRAAKLEKYWDNVTTKQKQPILDSNKYIRTKGWLYKQVTQLVTETTDFNQLINNIFLEEPKGIGLVGLHTCGNLGPTSIRIFNSNNNIRSICNVSCCYHLLNEKYLANSAMGSIDPQKVGFPMSRYLLEKNFQFNRATRMLSAQSLDRILHNKELPSKIIFYRALLEILLMEISFTGKHVGKMRKKPENFAEYVRQASKKLDITIAKSDNELEELYEDYKPRREELSAFYLIRCMLAPGIEALILLDRYLFLLEKGHTNVHLVQLFDPVISPRCYGLVSYR